MFTIRENYSKKKKKQKRRKEKTYSIQFQDFNLRLWCFWFTVVVLDLDRDRESLREGDFEEVDQGWKGEIGRTGFKWRRERQTEEVHRKT